MPALVTKITFATILGLNLQKSYNEVPKHSWLLDFWAGVQSRLPVERLRGGAPRHDEPALAWAQRGRTSGKEDSHFGFGFGWALDS